MQQKETDTNTEAMNHQFNSQLGKFKHTEDLAL